MKHLTVEELIDFVTAREPDEQFLSLASRVTEHVRKCRSCLSRLNAFLVVSDGLNGKLTAQRPGEAQKAKPENNFSVPGGRLRADGKKEDLMGTKTSLQGVREADK